MAKKLEKIEIKVDSYAKSNTKKFENFREEVKVWRHTTQTSILPEKSELVRLIPASTVIDFEEVEKMLYKKENFELLVSLKNFFDEITDVNLRFSKYQFNEALLRL